MKLIRGFASIKLSTLLELKQNHWSSEIRCGKGFN
jgi:hypothetical protein